MLSLLSGVRCLPWLLPALLLAGCGGQVPSEPPPRARSDGQPPIATSRIDLPLIADLDTIDRRLDARIPRTIAAVDREEKACIPAARVTLCLKHVRPCKGEACKDIPCKTGFQKAKVTPDLACRIVGHVTRGPITLSGEGETLLFRMPLSAEAQVRDLAGFITTSEATGKAVATARVRLTLAPDWTPVPTVDLSYQWTEAPGLTIAGRRVTFEKEADRALAKLVARLEAEAPRLARELHAPDLVRRSWNGGFAVLQLNRANPEVWMRVTPRALGVGGYRVEGRRLRLDLGLEAASETFVGMKPEAPVPTPLPPPSETDGDRGFHLVVPVLADYEVIAGALEKALAKVAARGLAIEPFGTVEASFGRPTLYATDGGRLALGLPIRARGPAGLARTAGTVWLTAAVSNRPDTQLLEVHDLAVSGEMGGASGQLLLAVAQAPAVTDTIAQELSTNFNRDFEKLMGKIRKELADKRLGPFILDARFDRIGNGVVQPRGDGAWLLVDARGTAELRWSPEAKAMPRRGAGRPHG